MRRAERDDIAPPRDPFAARPEGRKLAGILVETAPLGAGRVAVIGVGINVRAQEVADAASGVASLDEIDADATPAATLARVAPALFAALRSFDAAGFAAFADRFAAPRRAARPAHRRPGAHGDVEGIAAGVGADGSLRDRHRPTGPIAVASGEWRLTRIERGGRRHAEGAAGRCWSSPTCSSSRSPAAGSTASSACARSAIASPSGSPTRCGRETIRLLPVGGAASAAPIDPGVPCSRRRPSPPARRPRSRRRWRANLPAGAWVDIRGERDLGTRDRGDAHATA